MKTKSLTLLSFLFIIIFASCEGPKDFSVTVVDKTTQQPIDSVLVKVKAMAGDKEMTAYNLEGYTDSTGKFSRTEMIGYGLSLKRWDFYMEYHKKGYSSKTEVNRTEGTVELEY